MLRLSAFAFLAATAEALTLRPTAASVVGRVQRSRKLFAQLSVGWATGVDEASGQTYYYNEQTGQSQWEPPQSATTEWIVAPTDGTLHEYTLRPGEEQVLGRYDMAEPEICVSRVQCLVRVAADGTASVTSLGKPQTRVVVGADAWRRSTVILGKEQTHVLKDGEQIALHKDHISGFMHAVYTVYAVHAQQGGYVQEQQDHTAW